MKALAGYVGAAALVLVAVMVAAPTSLAAVAQAPQAVETPQQQTQAPPATGHQMSMMNQSAADQPTMGQMGGQGQMMDHGRMMGANANVEQLVNAVKSATGDAKIDALADLIVGLFSRSQGMMSASGMGVGGMTMGGAMGNGSMHAAASGMHQGGSGSGSPRRTPQVNR
jgi:hypothetical protein